LPSWAEPGYVAHNVAEFQRTGFHGGLNYYRAAEPYFYLSGAWKGAKITQPSFYISGKADGLQGLYPPMEKIRAGLPGLVGNLELDLRCLLVLALAGFVASLSIGDSSPSDNVINRSISHWPAGPGS
jgi:hypothetical protein